MPDLQVKKVVAVCFLEAAKVTLEQLGAHRLELAQQSVGGPDDLPRLYGDVRRLRDYLQRCVSSSREVVAIDLAPADLAMLVACCRRLVETVDYRLEEQAILHDEREWLVRKRQVLGDWAVELAEKPLFELPLPRVAPVLGEAVRAIDHRIQMKIYGDVTKRQKFIAPGKGPDADAPSGGGSAARGIATFGEHMSGARMMAETDLAIDAEQLKPANEPEPPAAPAAPPLLDNQKIADPRLRSLVSVDLSAFARCVADGDYRLATIMLASIMESALLDHAIPRRAALGLTGQPDTWVMHDVLLRAMGDAVQGKDRSLAFHLFAARNLLRPALQMVTPAVVTAASFERMRDFVERALHAQGFGTPFKTLPPGAVQASDLPPV
ncbi:MAG: hypothetical protein KAI24_22140 [Planctomycetes bacterium]|nr:hypothetical protein [Planctomycetota bacterium]